MKKLVKILPFCLALVSKPAIADLATLGKSALDGFQVNGFLSVAAAWTDVGFLPSGVEPVYSTYVRKRPSFEEDSDVGLQFTKLLKEDVGITIQFLATAAKEWEVNAIWAFLKWEPNDSWQFRVGRMRTSPYMLSEFIDVGYAYPWVRPPEEVYSQIPSEFSNLTGVDAKYRIVVFSRDLVFKVFYGATNSHLSFPSALPLGALGRSLTIFDTVQLRLRDVWCLNLKFGDEVFNVFLGYQSTRLTIGPNTGTLMEQLNAFLNAIALPIPAFGFPGIGLDYVNYFSAYNVQSSLKSMGYQFDWKNVVSIAEIVKRSSQSPISANVIGWYVMGGYHVKQFLPHITFAREKLVDNKVRRFNSTINALFMTPMPLGAGSPVPLDVVAQSLIYPSADFDGGTASQHSLTLGVRWDIYPGIAIKGEYKHIHPDYNTPGLFSASPGKSAHLYSVAVDAVM